MMSKQETRTIDILEKARDLISDPDRWTQGELARGPNGRPLGPCSPHAVRWCAAGALYCVGRGDGRRHAQVQLDLAALVYGAGYFSTSVNDFRGHATVMDMFAEAIATARCEL